MGEFDWSNDKATTATVVEINRAGIRAEEVELPRVNICSIEIAGRILTGIVRAPQNLPGDVIAIRDNVGMHRKERRR